MSLTIIKKITQPIGLYRFARTIYRHTFNRSELKQETNDFDFYKQLIKPGDLVFDVGANFGQKTRVFLKLGANVVAFEPQPICWRELLHRCGRPQNLTLVKQALGEKSGVGVLYLRDHEEMASLKENWYDPIKGTEDVTITTLDAMITKYGQPFYIKIDVEGYEYEVLKGLSRPIEYISMEYHLDNEENINKAFTCINRLSDFGEITLNITPADNNIFHFDRWLTIKEFKESFPSKFTYLKEYKYGDIYVKTSLKK